MDFSVNKQDTFAKRIISLPDQPNMQPDELKAYFDSSPEEVRQAHNNLCDALTTATSDTSAAANIGFTRTAGVPADTVQAAVENVQSQVKDAMLGNIPSGSVTNDKLAQDVRDHFTAIENSVTTETAARTSGDSNLQGKINTLNSRMATAESAIARKCEITTGSYTGTGTVSRQTIALGYQPAAVFVCAGQVERFDDTIPPYDFVIAGLDGMYASIVSNGFTVTDILNNPSWSSYHYIAFKSV